MMNSEKAQDLINKFETSITNKGGRVIKTEGLGMAFYPEYLVILPGGHIGFVEIKGSRELFGRLSSSIHELRMLGCAACAISEEKQVNDAIAYILSNAGKDPSWLAYNRGKEWLDKHKRGDGL